MRLSVIIIAKNEADSIAVCLDSVAWADERIVLDGGSQDDTVAIARDHGARVEMTHDWPGFGPQKNRALALATGDWVLSLDADETVSAELAQEIRQTLQSSSSETMLYRIPRLSSYCGRTLRHGGWWPDYVMRLFRRGQAQFSEDLVHERLVGISPGAAGTLTHPLLHQTYATLEEALEKADRYSTLGAEQAFARGERASLGTAIGHALWAFVRTWVIRRSFLDGGHGFLLAVTNAHTTFYRYAKLWLRGP